jgi:CheY-like chemotaxis protein
LARKILLADDSVTAQNMGRKILADAGYDVVTVNNGSAALKRITEIKPDLIVLDVYMPGYSGLEVCQRLKDAAATAHIPVLLTVGKLEPFKPEEARRVRADAHIVKPFEASELLSAITRLEDRMVPQQSEGGRYSTSASGVERFSGEGNGRTTESKAGADTGWKSRLGFPSKKKKEEPEPESEDIAAAATFRDFRKAKGKTGATVPLTVKEPPPPGQEPGLVPDIPRDITPEELDALSALAAKLDGPTPAAENIAPLAGKMGPGMSPAAELAAADTEVAKTEVPKAEVDAPAAAADAKKDVETPAPVAEAAVEVPQRETGRPEAQHQEMPAAVVAVAVNTAPSAQAPAPVDQHDEPMFVTAASAVGQTTEEMIEAKPAEAVAKSEGAEACAPAEAVAAKDKGSKPEASETEEPAPSDEALAEALRLLTPATANVDVSTVPSHGTVVAAGPRWVAEPAALTTEEAAISLEAEMFSTFAATFAAASGGDIASVGITGVSAIAAAVESRLAEAELAASAKALSEQAAERPSETTAAVPETSVVEAPAEVVAAVSNTASPVVVDGIEPVKVEPQKIEAENLEAERTDSPAKVAEEAPAEQPAAATFAAAGSKDEVGVKADQNEEPGIGTTAAVVEENQDSSSDSGGQDSMGKDVKAKSGKSNWHQIHTAPPSVAASNDVVEAAKQAAAGAEESPKAMAAAAAAEGSAFPSATDASTIASIVDSVMADLRPKIVEEIAKKLAGK